MIRSETIGNTTTTTSASGASTAYLSSASAYFGGCGNIDFRKWSTDSAGSPGGREDVHRLLREAVGGVDRRTGEPCRVELFPCRPSGRRWQGEGFGHDARGPRPRTDTLGTRSPACLGASLPSRRRAGRKPPGPAPCPGFAAALARTPTSTRRRAGREVPPRGPIAAAHRNDPHGRAAPREQAEETE